MLQGHRHGLVAAGFFAETDQLDRGGAHQDQRLIGWAPLDRPETISPFRVHRKPRQRVGGYHSG
jgi:hypothetical protein